MSEKTITIEGSLRKGTGKQYAKKLRKEGKIPANFMTGGKATNIELDPKWLGRAYSQGKTFDLNLDGETKKVKIQEVCIHPTKRTALHVDLVDA